MDIDDALGATGEPSRCKTKALQIENMEMSGTSIADANPRVGRDVPCCYALWCVAYYLPHFSFQLALAALSTVFAAGAGVGITCGKFTLYAFRYKGGACTISCGFRVTHFTEFSASWDYINEIVKRIEPFLAKPAYMIRVLRVGVWSLRLMGKFILSRKRDESGFRFSLRRDGMVVWNKLLNADEK